MKISVIIVNHNAADYVRLGLAALPESCPGYEIETIVMDNSDEPIPIGEADHWEQVENRGFGAGCNQGAGQSSGELLLFLNPDGVPAPGAVSAAAKLLLETEKAGLTGIRTVLPDGSFETGCLRGVPTPGRAVCYFLHLDRLFPNSRLCGGYHMTWLDRKNNQEVESVSGSFMLITRRLFEELGGFDEAFFMYGEDLDLCFRVRKAGYKVLYCADGEMLHYHGKSGRSERQTAAFYESMRIFYDKNLAGDYSRLTGALVHGAVELLRRRAVKRWRRQDG